MTRQQNPIAAQIATEIDAAARQLATTTAQIAATPAIDTADLWRLFRSDSAAAWTALANLSEQQLVVQAVAMASYLFEAESKLVSAEKVLSDWQAKLVKRATVQSTDPSLPSVDAILDAAQEYGEQAQRRGDFRTMRRLDRVRMNLLQGARLAAQGGDLLVQSVNNPGQVYCVRSHSCSCPNGGVACWHAELRDLLGEMAEDRAAATDILADAAATRAALGRRIAVERARVWRRTA